MSPKAPSKMGEAPDIPLSINPDPKYFVEAPNNPFGRLVQLIEFSDGGVFGITGVRGAGKSILLKKVADHFQDRHYTIEISAPVSASREMEFFLMLFRTLCDSVIVKLRALVFRERFDLKAIGTRAFWKRLFLFVVVFVISAGLA